MFTQRVHANSFMPLFTQPDLREQTHPKANKKRLSTCSPVVPTVLTPVFSSSPR